MSPGHRMKQETVLQPNSIREKPQTPASTYEIKSGKSQLISVTYNT